MSVYICSECGVEMCSTDMGNEEYPLCEDCYWLENSDEALDEETQ